ncbi:MAG: hypothetical protein J5903_01790 [Clostridia bacterium]|nr:hypothetical protein [Clostridia bacterium]
MKSKKLIAFASAVTMVALAISSYSVTAYAEPGENDEIVYSLVSGEVTERTAYENPFDYLKATKGEGENAVDVDVDTKDLKIELSYKDDNDEWKVDEDGEYYNWKSSASTIEYLADGEYLLKFYYEDNDDETHKYIVDDALKVNSVKNTGAPFGLHYIDLSTEEGEEKLAAARSAAADAVSDGQETYTIPVDEMWALMYSEVYARKDLKISVYAITPGSSVPTSPTGTNSSGSYPTISVGKTGTYKYWVLYEDAQREPYQAKMTTEDLTLKADGWYDADDKLIVPVFAFNGKINESVKIVASGANEKGSVGQVYNNVSFTITNGTLDSITLLYAADENSEFAAATEEDAEFDASAFTATSISFKPLKKGVYRVKCVAVGTKTDETKEQYADVKVTKTFQEAQLVDMRLQEFFANNWESLIFLGIAALCLIGIVIVALYKPKEAADNGKTKTADVTEDTIDASAPADNAQVEQPEAEPVEEVPEAQPVEEQPEVEPVEQHADEQPEQR